MDMHFGNNCERSGNEKNRKSQQLPNKEEIHEIKQCKLWHDEFYSNLEKGRGTFKQSQIYYEQN